MKVQQFRFSSIRNDWYFGNSVVPRAILRCIRGERRLVFAGFPRQWIPMLEWFGIPWQNTWALPQVLAYDAGVPDVYRVLRLARKWFGRAGYEVVFDCLQFEPYRDVLRIFQSEGSICQLERIKIPAQRHFYMK